jgi:hypothetical protein
MHEMHVLFICSSITRSLCNLCVSLRSACFSSECMFLFGVHVCLMDACLSYGCMFVLWMHVCLHTIVHFDLIEIPSCKSMFYHIY